MLSRNNNKSEKFGIDFIKFFKNFVNSASKSLRELAEIQKNYPKEYMQFKEFQMDPTLMIKLFDEMDPNIRVRLIAILITSLSLSQKVNTNIFNLSAKEQIALAKEIEAFMKLAEKNLQEIQELKE